MRTRCLVVLVGALLGTNANGSAAPITGCGTQSLPDSFASSPYSGAFQPTCHNCYYKGYYGVPKNINVSSFQGVLGLVKNVELDIWDTWIDTGGGGVKGQWYVRHATGPGNDNFCTGASNST